MRDAAFACIRRIGVETGGSNIQFAVDPRNGEHDRDRDEPARVAVVARSRARPPGSRSRRSRPSSRSATASTRCATTSRARRPRSSSPRSTTSSPRSRAGRSRSCPASTPVLGTQMQSVGEVMAIGRTFLESLQKALRSLETGRLGLNCDPGRARARRARRRRAGARGRGAHARTHLPDRGRAAASSCRSSGCTRSTGIDPWFLRPDPADSSRNAIASPSSASPA